MSFPASSTSSVWKNQVWLRVYSREDPEKVIYLLCRTNLFVCYSKETTTTIDWRVVKLWIIVQKNWVSLLQVLQVCEKIKFDLVLLKRRSRKVISLLCKTNLCVCIVYSKETTTTQRRLVKLGSSVGKSEVLNSNNIFSW